MPKLTPAKREEIIRRRGNISAKDGLKHPITNLEIHHMNRNTDDNRPANLKVLTRNEHQVLHGKGRTKR
jgi:hypothetical protein